MAAVEAGLAVEEVVAESLVTEGSAAMTATIEVEAAAAAVVAVEVAEPCQDVRKAVLDAAVAAPPPLPPAAATIGPLPALASFPAAHRRW